MANLIGDNQRDTVKAAVPLLHLSVTTAKLVGFWEAILQQYSYITRATINISFDSIIRTLSQWNNFRKKHKDICIKVFTKAFE